MGSAGRRDGRGAVMAASAVARGVRDAGGRPGSGAVGDRADLVDHCRALGGHRGPPRRRRPYAAGSTRRCPPVRAPVCGTSRRCSPTPCRRTCAGPAHPLLSVGGPAFRLHQGAVGHGAGPAARSPGQGGGRRPRCAVHRRRREGGRVAAVREARLHPAGDRLYGRLLRPGADGRRRAHALLPGLAGVRRQVAGAGLPLADRTGLRRRLGARLLVPTR